MRSHELTHNTLTISFFRKYVVANASVCSGFALSGLPFGMKDEAQHIHQQLGGQKRS